MQFRSDLILAKVFKITKLTVFYRVVLGPLMGGFGGDLPVLYVRMLLGVVGMWL